ncbi:MAG TPA: DUF1328 domain-containing protein [Kofleriaceae bacterium]|nr:DUF1328 domain-containing protein [Kofleriaceae bacterium]
MFGWALAFLVIATAAGVFAFSGVAAGAASISKVVLAIALLVAVMGAVVAVVRRRTRR